MSVAEKVPIGFLNRRIEIDQMSLAANGEFTWTPLATVWGGFAQLSPTERDGDGRIVGIARWRFTIRWRDDVTSASRIVYNGRIFRLVATADPTGDQRYLVIEAEEELR
jgi:SPP1 family predicted phage head-tail adaptor